MRGRSPIRLTLTREKRFFNASAYTCVSLLSPSSSSSSSSRSLGGGERFEGMPIKIVRGARGRKERFEFFYGGLMTPDGIGHGHVVCNEGEAINYWRKPSHEGGQVMIDDNFSSEQLASHMF